MQESEKGIWDTIKPYNDIKIDVCVYNSKNETTTFYSTDDFPINKNNTTPKN